MGLLLELEVDGKGEPYGHCLAIHLTGDKFRQGANYTHCFFIQVGVFATEHFTYRAILFHNKLHYHATLDIVLGRHGGIFDVVGYVLHQFSFATGELGHLLYCGEDFLLLGFGLLLLNNDFVLVGADNFEVVGTLSLHLPLRSILRHHPLR